MAKEFNKVKALDELMVLFTGAEKKTFSEQMNTMVNAQNFLDEIYVQGIAKGFEAGIKKIEIENDSN
jgi:hypothetical protein